MAIASSTIHDPAVTTTVVGGYSQPGSASISAVSWAAVFAGATVAAALSLVLLLLGVGLGLSSVSPWAFDSVRTSTFGATTVIWLTVTQLVASGVGGYLAGRLRTKWVAVHTDEVFFRDTAHGLLAWAVATLAAATVLATTAQAIVSEDTPVGVGRSASDSMLSAAPISVPPMPMLSDDTERGGVLIQARDYAFHYHNRTLIAHDATHSVLQIEGPDIGTSPLPQTRSIAPVRREPSGKDLRAIDRLMARRDTGHDATRMAQSSAVTPLATTQISNEVLVIGVEEGRQRALAYSVLWLSISLLVGAFVASWAATFGGKRRDL